MRPFAPHLDGFQDAADQLAAHLRRRAAEAFAAHTREKRALATVADFGGRRARLRRHMLQAIGGVPDIPARVQGTVTGRVGASAAAPFAIEKLLLETLPGVLATANLYLPVGTSPAPAVLFLCGHAKAAKAYPPYQRVCRALARAGFVVLALDPVGQGERLQYLDPATGREIIAGGTSEHAHAGFQCTLAGYSVARYFLADAMAAVSHLSARPEVDRTRIGVTGNSGGGTQSSYLILLDERLAAGAPCTFVTDRENYMATGQAHDAEQNIWGAVAAGLDCDDLASGLCPKPLLLGAVAGDFFCVEGTLRAHARLEHAYGLYGCPQNLHTVVAPGDHGFSDVLREAAVRFFRLHLLGETALLPPGLTVYAPPAESPLPSAEVPTAAPEDVLPAEALQVTAGGQAALDHPTARTVHDLNVEAFRARRAAAGPDPEGRRARLARAVLGDRPRAPMWVRVVRAGVEDGVCWSHRYTFSEPDIAVPMLLAAVREDGPVTVAALPEGTATPPDRLKTLVAERGRVLLFDPRGDGAAAQRPVNGRAPDGLHGTLHKLNADAMMLGDTLLAMRAFDALRVLEYARRIAPEVRVLGDGVAGVPLLLAAALADGDVSGAQFAGLPGSFADLVTERCPAPHWALEAYGLAVDWPDVPELLAMVGR